ncbi:hypothetical protein [Prevotella aurantiaca]|uniref:hypothetical protein n=1 Tax=Prevotella aurantiaca TaxID=596085 RepID=UPI0028E55A2E|nr:hypothetical protein [Prevotella aurantiaca]
MLESIGSTLSKDELRVIIGGGEDLQSSDGTPTTTIDTEVGGHDERGGKGKYPCDGKGEGAPCIWHGKFGRCEHFPFSYGRVICVVRDFKGFW